MHKLDPGTDRPRTDQASDADAVLPWPPPGLGRLTGDAYAAVRWFGAGALLILPLLAMVVSDPGMAGLGVLGGTLGVGFLLALAGVPILLAGYVQLDRLFRRVTDASRSGYSWPLIALIAADRRGDAGFLLQGARFYSELSAERRRHLAWARILAAASFLVSTAWLSLGFALGVVAAARGVVGATGLLWLVLGPSLALAAAGLVLTAWEEGELRRARKTWFRRPWQADLAASEVGRWTARWAEREPVLPLEPAGPNGGRSVLVSRGLGIATGVGGLAAFVTVFILVFSSLVAGLMAELSVPNLDRISARISAAEALRPWALEPTAEVSAREAGEALQAISFVGRSLDVDPPLRPPVRHHPVFWFGDRDGGSAAPTPGALVAWLADPTGLPEPELMASISAAAAHPAHAEFTVLARAGALDVVGGRFLTPFPDHQTAMALPLPRMRDFSAATTARLARAAVQAAGGDRGAAELTLRETLTAGLLLVDQGLTLFEALIGAHLADAAAQGLEALHASTGSPEALQLARAREAANRAVEATRRGAARADAGAMLRALPSLVVDSAAPLSMRWESFMMYNTIEPCMNPHRLVFGPGPERQAWRETARSGLVRTDADAHMFDLLEGGLMARAAGPQPDFLARLLMVTMGAATGDASCARLFAALM